MSTIGLEGADGEHDAKLALCLLSASIREVFEISGFDKIIPVYDSRAEALASLAS